MRHATEAKPPASPEQPDKVHFALMLAADCLAGIYDEVVGISSRTLSPEVLGSLLALKEALDELPGDVLGRYRLPDGRLSWHKGTP